MSSSARAFLADLAKARETQYDSISGIRRGDSDGEVSLLYSNDSLEEPLEIKILSMGASPTSLANIRPRDGIITFSTLMAYRCDVLSR